MDIKMLHTNVTIEIKVWRKKLADKQKIRPIFYLSPTI